VLPLWVNYFHLDIAPLSVAIFLWHGLCLSNA